MQMRCTQVKCEKGRKSGLQKSGTNNWKICSNAVQLRDALKEIKPSKIAVAFVGDGWKRYVSSAHIKEIVLSPTLGSNPKAIEEIMDLIGPSNVYFLDNLHSKIYLGKESALLGSSNLSDNGFANSRLLETGVLIKQWQSSIWHGLNTGRGSEKSPAINNYRSDLDRIHIAWYQGPDINYNKEAINAVVPDAKGIDPDDYFYDALHFHEKDSLQPGDWILSWHCRDDGYPRKNGEIYWFHVHHVVPNGVHDDSYTKLVGQAKNLKCPTQPFTLDSRTKSLIRDALNSGKFLQLLALNDDVWRLALADKVVPKFLEYVRKKANRVHQPTDSRITKPHGERG
jgi:hypothetical protein